ncbi:MAG TPA: transglutaminase-like domain-containing protein [Nitrososphaeraceae archaeon]|jgi:regulator of sirC expression with transglutaminase-like and TPR domain|nr:transglutaminase-like domain-containing protein [Nitrososphaeraceae archaeon]
MDLESCIEDWKRVVAIPIRTTENITRLAEFALHVSRILAYPKLNIASTLRQIDDLGNKFSQKVIDPKHLRPTQLIEVLNDFFFDEVMFKPNAHDYYNPANNYLNIVFERKTGIPITLSIIYMRIASKVDFTLYPVNFPAHFLVKYILDDQSAEIIIDPFNMGRIMDDYSLKELLERSYPHQNMVLTRSLLTNATASEVIVRLLNNLKNSFYESDDLERAEISNEMIISIDETNPFSVRDKGMIFLKRGQKKEALATLSKYLEMHPETSDADTILELIRHIRSQNT